MILAEDIKAVADIVAEAERYTALRKNRGCCPIHGGDNPAAFAIYPATGSWCCFTRCGGGDVIDLVMKVEGLGFRDAVRVLAGRYGLNPDSASHIVNRRDLSLAIDELRAFSSYLSGLRTLWLEKSKGARFNREAALGWIEQLWDRQPPKGLVDELQTKLTSAHVTVAICEEKLDEIDLQPEALVGEFLRAYYSSDRIRGRIA